MGSQTAETQKKASLLGDTKFRWLIFSVLVVGVFEFLSLAGWHLPPLIAAPFFAIVILAIGHRTLLGGLGAVLKLNFRSINLLLLIAAAGAFYLGEYEEAAVVIVLFILGERLEQFGIQTSRSALKALVDRTPSSSSGFGLRRGYRSSGLWIYDPFFRGRTFLPFFTGWSSPYGHGYSHGFGFPWHRRTYSPFYVPGGLSRGGGPIGSSVRPSSRHRPDHVSNRPHSGRVHHQSPTHRSSPHHRGRH